MSKDQALKVLKGDSLDPMEHLDLKLHNESYEPDLDESDPLMDLELPYGYEPIRKPHPYLEKRGIPLDHAIKNHWGISVAGYTKNRLIVPTFMDGRLVFWQARATWEDDSKDFKKVLNPKGVSARSVLYNYDRAKNFKKAIMVEGFVDATKVGPDAIATGGKNLHSQQVEFLKDSSIKEVVILWDRDAWGRNKRTKDTRSSAHKAIDLLRAYGFKVKAAVPPKGKDPGDYSYRSKELRDLIDNAKEPIFKKLSL